MSEPSRSGESIQSGCFRTADCPGILLASPGAVPIEIAHFPATRAILIDIEVALRARSRVLAATRVDPDFLSRKNLETLNIRGGDFVIFVVYAGIVVKICLLAL